MLKANAYVTRGVRNRTNKRLTGLLFVRFRGFRKAYQGEVYEVHVHR